MTVKWASRSTIGKAWKDRAFLWGMGSRPGLVHQGQIDKYRRCSPHGWTALRRKRGYPYCGVAAESVIDRHGRTSDGEKNGSDW
jgi:hypothetical protein